MSVGSVWNLRWQHERGKKQTNKQHTCLNANASGEVPQTLAYTTNKKGLDSEEQAAKLVLRVRTAPGCPEDNLRELR